MKKKGFPIIKMLIVLLLALAAGIASPAAQAPRRSGVRLPGHIPHQALREARWMGRLQTAATVPMAMALPLRNQSELGDLLSRLYDPGDSMHGKFLASEEFIEKFCPTESDYADLAAYARSLGMTVIGTHANRLLLDVSAPAYVVEKAFNLHLHRYQAPEGQEFFAPDEDPEVPDFIAANLIGIIGLNNAATWHHHSHSARAQDEAVSPLQVGTGPGNALTPNDIYKAYNLQNVTANGAGQVLGLFQLDGFTASDIAAYVNFYGLPSVPVQSVLVDGVSGKPGSGAGEVTLDIELQIAMAPGASRILVYEGPNSSTGVIDTYNRIATDNLAKQISTSWGLSESRGSLPLITAENSIFLQMAAQGQTIFAASGDSGAYDNGSTLSVDDPASQPYVTATGGTRLYLSGGFYAGETTWNGGSISAGAGGGGISSLWSIPSYQQGLISSGSLGSSTMRNVPDVAVNSDPNSGYSIFYKGGWYIFGGTSCAAPLWAGFTARVNQVRAANGLSTLGFANPTLYRVGSGANYGADFHDISDGSTNLYYPAVSGFDLAVGLGSMNGANLLSDLTSGSQPAPAPTAPPPSPTGLTATPGDAKVTLSWAASSGATSYKVYRGTSAGNLAFIVTVAATSYTNSGLANGTTYFYQVAAVNSAGSSSLSSMASATPAPANLLITSGPSASPGTTTAGIQWTTNIASTSTIRIGTSPNNLSFTGTIGTLVTSHALTISGLARRTTYYYQVSSTAGSVTVNSIVRSMATQ